MSNRVDISEVITLSDELDNAVSNINSSLDRLQANVKKFNSMESFSGKTANAAKEYFKDCHLTLIEKFQEAFLDIQENLNDHIDTFFGNVDSSNSAKIETNYLIEIDRENDILYKKINNNHTSIQRTIQRVSDICPINTPSFYSLTDAYSDTVQTINELEENLSTFTREGKNRDSGTKDFLHHIEKVLNAAGTEKGEARFNDYQSGTAQKEVLALKQVVSVLAKTNTLATGLTSSRAIAKAAQNQGLSVTKYTKNGKVHYRINATENALRALGVTPDKHAKKAFNQKKKRGIPKSNWSEQTKLKYQRNAPINYYDHKTGKQVLSSTGSQVVYKHPAMEAWNEKASKWEKVKTVGKATGKGAGNAFKDTLDVKDIVKSGPKNGLIKSLGPVGGGLSYYSNYHDARADGLKGKEAYSRAAVDTTVDVGVGGAVQAGLTAAGTAFIPVPGLGTAIGVLAGLGANWLLNRKFGKSDKSVMDYTKNAFRKIKNWFS